MRIRPSLRVPFLVLGFGAVLAAPSALSTSRADEGDAAAAAPALAARMEKGQVVWFRQSMKQDAEIDMGGMLMTTEMKMNQVWSQTCDAVDDKGVMAIRMKFGRVWGTMTNPQFGEVKFDSDDPDSGAGNPMAAAMTAALTRLSGSEMSGNLNPDGTMSNLKLPAELAADPAQKQVTDQLEKQLQGISSFPKGPVAVGTAWTVKTDMNLQGLALAVEMNNKVAETDAETVTVAHEGTMSVSEAKAEPDDGSDPRAAAMREMMSRMKIKESTMKGRSRIARKDGLLLATVMDQDMTMEMELPPEAAAQGASGGMKMRQKLHMTIDRTEAPEPKAGKPAETPGGAPAAPGDGAK